MLIYIFETVTSRSIARIILGYLLGSAITLYTDYLKYIPFIKTEEGLGFMTDFTFETIFE